MYKSLGLCTTQSSYSWTLTATLVYMY